MHNFWEKINSSFTDFVLISFGGCTWNICKFYFRMKQCNFSKIHLFSVEGRMFMTDEQICPGKTGFSRSLLDQAGFYLACLVHGFVPESKNKPMVFLAPSIMCWICNWIVQGKKVGKLYKETWKYTSEIFSSNKWQSWYSEKSFIVRTSIYWIKCFKILVLNHKWTVSKIKELVEGVEYFEKL